jgi:hypothetical protein
VLSTTYSYKQLPLSPWEATKTAETWKGARAPFCPTSQIAGASQGIAPHLLPVASVTRRSPAESIRSGPNGGLHFHFRHNAVKWSDPSTERYPLRPLAARRHLARRS